MDLTRTDASQNVNRFYRMEIVPGLFGDWALVREWAGSASPGRSGSTGTTPRPPRRAPGSTSS